MSNIRLTEAAVQRVRELAAEHGGRLDSGIILEEAKKTDSPLHGYITWNKTKAAEKCWHREANQIIKMVRVRVTTETHQYKVPAFIRDPERPAGEKGFVEASRIASDEDIAREALLSEFGRAASAMRRARAYAAMFQMADTVDQFTQELDAVRTSLESRATI